MFALALVIALSAAPATPLDVVKVGQNQVQRVLASQNATAAQLAAKTDGLIDVAELAKRALGPQWATLKTAQQLELTATLKALLRASYVDRFLKGDRTATDIKQEWGAETIEGNEARVASTVLALNDRFPIEFRLYRASATGAWRVYDVVTDDVSLVDVYASQFRKLIAEKGYEGLIAKLKARQSQLEQPSKS